MAIEQNGVDAESIFSQCYQSAFGHTCIAFSQRTDEIGVSYALEPRKICRANLIDDSVQRAGIGFPFQVNYSTDNLLPYYDPLRGDLRFEKIVADLAPKL